MIFKKQPLQGNFILANGEQVVFVDGYFETEDAGIISQLSGIYEVVDKKEVSQKAKAPVEQPVVKGIASSAALSAVTKAAK